MGGQFAYRVLCLDAAMHQKGLALLLICQVITLTTFTDRQMEGISNFLFTQCWSTKKKSYNSFEQIFSQAKDVLALDFGIYQIWMLLPPSGTK